MGIKKSVYLSDETKQYIEARNSPHNDSVAWSDGINRSVSALNWLGRELLPELSEKEWNVILNVYTGSLVDFNYPLRIASDMMDNVGVIDLNEIADEYYRELVIKTHSFSQPEQWAVMDFVLYYWSNDWSESADFNEVLSSYRSL